MNILLLSVAIITLFVVLKKITTIESRKANSVKKQIKQHTILSLWGILLGVCILIIPYQIWIITGSSTDWNGVYIIGIAFLVTVVMSMTFYSKCKVRKQLKRSIELK